MTQTVSRKPDCPYTDIERSVAWHRGYAAALSFAILKAKKLISENPPPPPTSGGQ